MGAADWVDGVVYGYYVGLYIDLCGFMGFVGCAFMWRLR